MRRWYLQNVINLIKHQSEATLNGMDDKSIVLKNFVDL